MHFDRLRLILTSESRLKLVEGESYVQFHSQMLSGCRLCNYRRICCVINVEMIEVQKEVFEFK